MNARWRFWKRDREIETEPTTMYTEIRDHRGYGLVGYIPDTVFDEITGRVQRADDGTFWLTKEQSARCAAHPNFITAAESEGRVVHD